MHPLLTPALQGFADPKHRRLGERGSILLEHAVAPQTARSTHFYFTRFSRWCAEHDLPSLPTTTDVLWQYMLHGIASHLNARTIIRALSVIARVHQSAGYLDPRSSDRLRSEIRKSTRKSNRRPPAYTPLAVPELRQLVSCIPFDFNGIRDKAILLLSYAGAMTSGLVVSLNVEDLHFTKRHLIINSSHFPERSIAIAAAKDVVLCPVRILRLWVNMSGRERGPLFLNMWRKKRLTVIDAWYMFRKRALKAGLKARRYCMSSLRAGAITSAAANGGSTLSMMLLGRLSVPESVAKYRKRAAQWQAPKTLAYPLEALPPGRRWRRVR